MTEELESLYSVVESWCVPLVKFVVLVMSFVSLCFSDRYLPGVFPVKKCWTIDSELDLTLEPVECKKTVRRVQVFIGVCHGVND